jgi:hypothetical protein
VAVAVVDLHPLVNQPLFLKFPLAKISSEESSIVFPFFQIDGVGSGERQFAKFHGKSLIELDIAKGERAEVCRIILNFAPGLPFWLDLSWEEVSAKGHCMKEVEFSNRSRMISIGSSQD